jgi:hypothetical protein
MRSRFLTAEQLDQFRQRGWLFLPQLFDAEEITFLRRAAAEDMPPSSVEDDLPAVGECDPYDEEIDRGFAPASSLKQTRIIDWNEPGDGIYGMFARCERLVGPAEDLLEGEVYHFHSRMVMKDPRIGGAWPWHQDYAWWYYNGVLQPLLVSAFVAVDPATRDNGCLNLLEGSHHCGRLDHLMVGDRVGADRERVEHLLQRLSTTTIEMRSGDVLFFHANLLHCSGRNRSNSPRWSMICVYNAARNDPYCDARHARYKPLVKVPDHAIKEAGRTRFPGGADPVPCGPDGQASNAR